MKANRVIIEAPRPCVREDATNEERSPIDPGALRPLIQLGRISYGRVRETFELPRPSFAREVEREGSGLKKLLSASEDVSPKDGK